MKLSNGLLSSFSFFLLAIWIFVFSTFQNHFNGGKEFELEIQRLRAELDQQKLNYALLEYKFNELNLQSDSEHSTRMVASDAGLASGKNHSALPRKMASIATPLQLPPKANLKEVKLQIEKSDFENCKTAFLNGKYQEAIKKLKNYIEEFPLSSSREEALFLLSDSYFYEKDYSNSIYYIDQLLNQFPESDLSGYALLRMGQISELNNQNDEALEFYHLVQSKFSSEKLVSKAKQMAQSLEKNLE